MARFKHQSRKLRLVKLGRRTRWAPIWVSQKIHNLSRGRRIHPGRHTEIKRSWKRTRTKA